MLTVVQPNEILPSQDFLKEKTVRFIFECFLNGNVGDLPPTPLVRVNENDKMVAIDGHNLIAARLFRNEPIEVFVASSLHDGLPETSEANKVRNQELVDKWDAVLDEQRKAASEGIASFADLIAKYQSLFVGVSS